MEHEPGDEVREALLLVGRDVVGCDRPTGEDRRSPTERLGLPTFDEVAVVEYVHGRLEVVLASGRCIEDEVALESQVGAGPSTEAVTSAEMVVCRDLRAERRWPGMTFASCGRGGCGLRRLVVAPLRLPGEPVLGAIVLAGHRSGLTTPGEVASVRALAERSSLVVTARVSRCRETRALLALDRVRLVGLAVGVVMATEDLSERDALGRLRTRSRRSGSRLVETAVAVLTERQMSFQ